MNFYPDSFYQMNKRDRDEDTVEPLVKRQMLEIHNEKFPDYLREKVINVVFSTRDIVEKKDKMSKIEILSIKRNIIKEIIFLQTKSSTQHSHDKNGNRVRLNEIEKDMLSKSIKKLINL